MLSEHEERASQVGIKVQNDGRRVPVELIDSGTLFEMASSRPRGDGEVLKIDGGGPLHVDIPWEGLYGSVADLRFRCVST